MRNKNTSKNLVNVSTRRSSQKLGESSCVCRKNGFPGSTLVFEGASPATNFGKPGHFANSCSRLRAGYEDFIAIVLPIQRSWGGFRIVSYWQRSRGGGLITCAPTPLGNSDLQQRDRHDQKSDSFLCFQFLWSLLDWCCSSR